MLHTWTFHIHESSKTYFLEMGKSNLGTGNSLECEKMKRFNFGRFKLITCSRISNTLMSHFDFFLFIFFVVIAVQSITKVCKTSNIYHATLHLFFVTMRWSNIQGISKNIHSRMRKKEVVARIPLNSWRSLWKVVCCLTGELCLISWPRELGELVTIELRP